MTKTVALSMVLAMTGASLATAQTTSMGGTKTASKPVAKSSSMMKAAPKAPVSKGTATGGTPGGKADKN